MILEKYGELVTDEIKSRIENDYKKMRERDEIKDIEINNVLSDNKVDRTLDTIDPLANQELWKMGGYMEIPSIRENISELAEFKGTKKILEFK